MSRREPDVLLDDIVQCISNLIKYTQNCTLEQFLNDQKTKDAIIRNLEIIGEASSKLPLEFREKYDHIPWARIIGMRNKVIHEYFEIEEKIIWEIATEDAIELYGLIKKILDELDAQHGNS